MNFAQICTQVTPPLDQWLLTVGLGLGIWFIVLYARKILMKILSELSPGPSLRLLQTLLVKTHMGFLLVVVWYCALQVADLSFGTRQTLNKVLAGAGILQLGIWLHYLINSALKLTEIKETVETRIAKGAIDIVKYILWITLWYIVAISLLGNMGFEITPLITGLGAGGIALALGVQNTLQEIAASVSILFDKPFLPGDFIIVDGFMGVVDSIGIKTTRITSLTGEQIVFSNTDLLSSRIRNYKKMTERRSLFNFHIPYDTSCEKIRKIPEMVERIVKSHTGIRFDRAHLKQFGEYAFEFEVVYFILEPDFNLYMDLQQSINFKIIAEFEKERIYFAYPKPPLVGSMLHNFARPSK